MKIAGSLKHLIVILATGATACGGEGGSSSGSAGTVTIPPVSATPPPPPPTSSACSLRNRQDFAFSVLNEWYLFPETLPASLDPSPYTTVQAYIDALTATARSQNRDRFFTYLTSIAEENAFFASGSTAGFGVRFAYQGDRLFVIEAFEGAPALAAGLDRGTEILSIGTSETNLVPVRDILASQGTAGVTSALGPSTAGTSRVLRISDAGGARNVTVTKANFEISPLSTRYGVKVIDNGGGQRVGYINMRTFISTADNQLRTAFADFRAQGITNFVIDFRYNGGGLVSTAELMGDLLGGNRSTSDIFSITRFRASKSSNNETRRFAPQSQSVSPIKIAFISTNATASASELVMNSFVPHLGVNAALVGSNSFGKPVGQIALDRSACDDRIRVVAFAKDNASGQGDYYSGLAGTMRTSCAAADDITRPLGDPLEASLRTALDFVAGRSCTPVSAAPSKGSAQQQGARELLSLPTSQSVAQREVPGLF